jgi:hypothetical protein
LDLLEAFLCSCLSLIASAGDGRRGPATPRRRGLGGLIILYRTLCDLDFLLPILN